jgi:Transglutaminase-like superfamily
MPASADRRLEALSGAARLPVGTKVGLALETLAMYARVRWLLRRHGLERTVGAVRTRPVARDPLRDGRSRAAGARLARAASRTLSPLPADTRCLVKSVVVTSLLARHGIASTLVIAVKRDGAFIAHAWVEQDGRPVLPAGDPALRRLLEL